jgi:NAD-reducing hydrogenase small subunit
MDERILELAQRMDLVYSPLVDIKTFPEGVDVTLVEGAVSTDEDMERIHDIRSRSRWLVSLGDCAGTGNVPAMRNATGLDEVASRVYPGVDRAEAGALPAGDMLPSLLARVCPVHEVVEVDLVVPGCPPCADLIFEVLSQLLDGVMPDLSDIGFG